MLVDGKGAPETDFKSEPHSQHSLPKSYSSLSATISACKRSGAAEAVPIRGSAGQRVAHKVGGCGSSRESNSDKRVGLEA